MNNWFYENKEIKSIKDLGEDVYGFIYIIKNKKTNQYYIGKKQILSKTNKKLGKKEKAALPITKGRRPTKKLVIKETNWKDYYGSNIQIQEDIKKFGKQNFERSILRLVYTKKQLSYYENYYHYKYEVLFDDTCYNNCIGGKYWKEDFVTQ